jgi:hypothetical protein
MSLAFFLDIKLYRKDLFYQLLRYYDMNIYLATLAITFKCTSSISDITIL